MWVKHRSRIANECRLAQLELVRLFNGGVLDEGGPEEDELFFRLLQNPQHWNYLEELDAHSDRIVFRPDQGQVYFLHTRKYAQPAPIKPCLSIVTCETGGWENQRSHASYPHYLLLDTIDVVEDTLQIYGSIRGDMDWEPEINGTTVKAGQQLRFDLDISKFRFKAVNLESLGQPLAP